MTRLSARAMLRAASNEVAAVRKAVLMVSSLNSRGYPLATSASTPNAVTVSKPPPGIRGMTVDILECVEVAIGYRHQFNHALRGMTGQPDGLFKYRPTLIIGVDIVGQSRDDTFHGTLRE